jgi:Domain of unknown function (DUF4845)
MKSTQHGLTFISLLVLMAIAGFFILLALRLGPIYIENYTIKAVLQGIKQESGNGQTSPREIRDLIDRRLYINEVRRITAKDVQITREDNKLKVIIAYQVKEHILGNVDALVSFSNSVELPVN